MNRKGLSIRETRPLIHRTSEPGSGSQTGKERQGTCSRHGLTFVWPAHAVSVRVLSFTNVTDHLAGRDRRW